MGIECFNPLLRELGIAATGTIPLTNLRGYRVAIDGHNWMYSRLAGIQSTVVSKMTPEQLHTGVDRGELLKEWLDACLQFCVTLMSYGITPLWVFDGDHPPEKVKTQRQRIDKKQAAAAELSQLREQVSQFTDELEITPDVIQRMKKLINQDTRIYRDEQEILRSTLEGLGLPCFRAVGEAEQLCSMMCLDGIAVAVFSTDTDNLCYGAPLMLTGFASPVYDPNIGDRVHHFEYTYLPSILQGLQMDMRTFRDLCILMTCDYNHKIPGVGKKTAHRLITQYRSIDLIPNYDISSLLAPQCRWLFMYRPYQSVISNGDSFQVRNLLAEQGRDVLEPLGLSKWLVRLSQIIPTLPVPQDMPLSSIDAEVLKVKEIKVPDPKAPKKLVLRVV